MIDDKTYQRLSKERMKDIEFEAWKWMTIHAKDLEEFEDKPLVARKKKK